MSHRITCPNRVVESVGVPVRSDTRFGDFPPVGLDEQAEFRIVVAGVEVLQASVSIVALPDPAMTVDQRGVLGG